MAYQTADQEIESVLITGGSGGIGFELARLFARDNCSIILVARESQKLEDAAARLREEFGVEVQTISIDLSLPSAPASVFDRVTRLGKRVDLLVNNAGFGVYGFFVESDVRKEIDMINVNVLALTQLTQMFLVGMIQRGHGRILNVASTAAFQPGPLMSVYYATKAYVLSFSSALANETAGTGVTVTTLCPGPTKTEFQVRADLTETRLFNGVVMSAEAVARAGYRGMRHGKLMVVPGLLNKTLAFGVRLAPRPVLLRVARWLQGQRNR